MKVSVVVAAVAVVAAGVWAVVAFSSSPEFDEQTRETIEAHAAKTGISVAAASDIERLIRISDNAAFGVSDEDLSRAIGMFRPYTGKDRLLVARSTAMVLVELIGNLEPQQIEQIREPLADLVSEYWQDPSITGQLFVAARNLNLHEDPRIDGLARKAIADESLPVESRQFIERVMFAAPEQEGS